MKLTHYRWFSFAEFLLVAICCIALSIRPNWGWWPLIVAASPWIIRIFGKDLPFRKTPFDLLIMMFLIGAFVGAWVAYDQDRAFHKFFLMIGAVLLFYTLVNQPAENLWLVILSLGIWGVLTNIIFLLVIDWAIFSADIGVIDQIGKWLTAVRPDFEITTSSAIHMFHPNVVGGINAILLPLSTASILHFWRKKNGFLTALSACLLLFIGLGLALTSSRAAGAAVLIGLGLFVALNKPVIRRFITRKHVLILLPMLTIVTGVIAPVILAESFPASINTITNITNFTSRITIARDTLFLITDFPLTGGGLGAFPGLYSEYILVIPHFIFNYSHNLYLDLALEQGIASFILWAGMILVCAITLNNVIKKHSRKKSKRVLATAVYASLAVMLIHGIADDPIYSNVWGLSVFFLFPGLSIAVSDQQRVFAIDKKYYRVGTAALVILLSAVALFFKPISSSWYANIGSVDMAKIALADWPTGEWDTGSNSDGYGQAEKHLAKAISLHNTSRTANHRLGLILMSRQEFQGASQYLESAFLSAPNHRGVRKSLGYCYTWLGKFDEAELILRHLPEAQAEMEEYAGWWQRQGRKDLADKALKMIQYLNIPQ